MLNLDEKLKKLPEKPGVYIMKDGNNRVIYIGKAINLRNRVRQYFQSLKNQPMKVTVMVEHIYDFDYIITENELEALILECNLIKKYKPRYNVLLKDDKHYPYIKITLNEDFPRVLKVREIKKDGAKYFGPYTDVKAVNHILDLIESIFPIRSCNKNIERIAGKERPCLNYHIDRCIGPCTGNIKKEDYREIIKEVSSFLEGKHHGLLGDLEEKMNKYAEALEFEKAAEIRDQVEALKKLNERQVIISSNLEDQDVIAYSSEGKLVCVQIFFVRLGKLLGRENFFLSDGENSDGAEIISSFIKQFYNKALFIPKRILIPTELQENMILEEWLSVKKGKKVRITVPQRGERRRLLEMAERNAEEYLRLQIEKYSKDKKESVGASQELGKYLRLDKNIQRIEAFDISNIQGVDNVGSMIVFQGGKPAKKYYRRFKIKSFSGQDDYESMREIIGRRFMRGLKEREEMRRKEKDYLEGKFSIFPDLLMIDGGQGQVNAVKSVLEQLGVSIPVCGMVKDNRHRTRGLIYQGDEIEIPINSSVFRLITRIQNEAHRFAINYHRSLRSKKIEQSVLDDIYGVGASRKKALIRHFKTIDNIKKASIDDLLEVKGISKSIAKNIYEFFNE